MKNFIDSLNTRYQLVKESKDNMEFYMNIYHYIHVIETTPELKKIVDLNEKETRKAIINIRNNPNIPEKEKAKLVSKVEKFSLYTFYINLEIPIYYPINDYINDPSLEHQQDPVALILIKGIENIETEKYSVKWNKKVLSDYDKKYKSQRNNFEYSLRQLHLMLLNILEKEKPLNIKIETFIDDIPLKLNSRTGDFTFYEMKGNISPATQEFKVLFCLLNNEDYQSDHLSIYKAIFPNTEAIQKTHKYTLSQIVRNLKEKLNILPKSKKTNPDIFKNVPKVGYRLIFKDLKENTE